MTETELIKLHKAENDPAKQAILHKLLVQDKAAQEGQQKALAEQRQADGQVALKCPKCGGESVLDAKRPEKAPKAKATPKAPKGEAPVPPLDTDTGVTRLTKKLVASVDATNPVPTVKMRSADSPASAT